MSKQSVTLNAGQEYWIVTVWKDFQSNGVYYHGPFTSQDIAETYAEKECSDFSYEIIKAQAVIR